MYLIWLFTMWFRLHTIYATYINSFAVFCLRKWAVFLLGRSRRSLLFFIGIYIAHIHAKSRKSTRIVASLNAVPRFTTLDIKCLLLFFYFVFFGWSAIRRRINWFSRKCQTRKKEKLLLHNLTRTWTVWERMYCIV